LNFKEYESAVSGFKSNPEEYHCSNINFNIRVGLLLLSTKKGSDKFKVALDKDFEDLNNGINKYILSSPIFFINSDISIKDPSK
jgi:hypothetical protein